MVSSQRRTALVVCPGRGTYNKTELGYLRRFHSKRAGLIAMADAYRRGRGQPAISELDSSASYDLSTFSRGDNAATLIYVCSIADYLAIDRNAYDIVAVTGNSMGWYTALACGGALTLENALHVVNAMGTLTHDGLIGGQVIYSLVDEDWREIPGRAAWLREAMHRVNARADCEIHVSIKLGGMLVLAGNESGIAALTAEAPTGPKPHPIHLHNHAAFHSPLMRDVSAKARATLHPDLFRTPDVPLIDGRGNIWRRHSTDLRKLWDYTFGDQVTTPYDFTSALRVAVREFAPDCLIVLGPGATLGGAVAQSLIECQWRALGSKAGFVAIQETAPFVLSMGREVQRAMVSPGEAAGVAVNV